MSKKKRYASAATDLENIITEDGILYSILSSLPLREAARTCVLSRRWGQLWTNRHRLQFDAENVFGAQTARFLDYYYRSNPHNYEERDAILTDKFVKSVDSVLQQHQGVRIEKFWVQFFLDKANSHHLDAWLRFAVESRTKFIILNLRRPHYKPSHAKEPYEFPCQLFSGHQGSAVLYLSISFCSLKPSIGFDGLNNLKSLDLVRLDVTDEDIKCLLSNCSTLQNLLVTFCPHLAALSISHPLSRLHNLTVMYCDGLKKIEIDARNLTRLHYEGGWVDLKFRESSQLKDAIIVFIVDGNVGSSDFALTKLSSKLPHLVELKLEIRDAPEVAYLPKDSISFTHLKGLYWILRSKTSLVCLVSLLNAAPLLEEIKLDCCTRVVEKPPSRLKKLWRKLPKHPHSCLEKVKIRNFYGDKWQTEIALYLIENALELKTMTLLSCKSSDDDFCAGAINYMRRKFPTIIIL